MSENCAVPLCLPNNYKWNEQSGKYTQDKDQERTSLCVIEAALERLRNVKGPVCVVSIAGPFSKGKSYILSKVFDQGEVFPLGHEMDSETKGIWMWIVPEKLQIANGLEVTVVLLDSEGINAVSGTFRDDLCIFTLTILLSSMLIFNSVGLPTRGDLDGLNYMLKLLHGSQIYSSSQTGDEAKGSTDDVKIFHRMFPFFTWLLRDVINLPEGCHDIKDFLLTKVFKASSSGNEFNKAKEVAESILNYFLGFDAFMLPPPSSDPDVVLNLNRDEVQDDINKSFLRGIDEFKLRLWSKLSPKYSFNEGEWVSGEGLAAMVISYVTALNTPGTLPNVQKALDVAVSTKCSHIKAGSVESYDKTMESEMTATVPSEIQERGPEAQRAFLKAMWSGEVQVYRGRLMFIGQDRAGKTSLKKSLLGIPFDPEEDSTVGIEVDPSKFEVDVDQVMNWQPTEQKDLAVHEFSEDIARIIATDLKYPNSLSVQTQPTEQIDPDVRGMDQISLSKKENVSMEVIGSKAPGSKKLELDEKEKRTIRHPDLFTGSLEERNEPLDLDIETNVVFSSELMERVVRYLKGLKLDQEIKAKEYKIDMWDFAGQHLYYASHPVFLSPRAVYILVCNLSKELNAVAEPCVKQGVTRKLQNTNGETNLENLLSWLISVRRLRPETKDDGKLPYVRPKVITVGTNADQLAVEDKNEMLMCIQESLTENDDLQKHVIRKVFSIDNTGSQADDRDELKKKILDVLRLEPYMGKKVPVRWFHFEKIVQALVAKKMYHVKREYLQTIVKEVCRIEDTEELELMLHFYHDLGQIVQHGSTIVLQTQWLIDLFKQVITVKPFNETDPCLNSCWLELQNRGILRMELIDHVFDEHIKKGLNKEDILSLMEHYGLIAKFSPTEKPRYFVPAQLTSPPAELCEKKPSHSDPCSLYVNFTEGFVPHGLFPQLVTRCIAWCSKHGFPKEPRLHECGARFFIGKQPFYSLVLICRKRSIKVVLTEINPASESSHSTSKDLEPWDVRAFLDNTLAGLSQELPWLCNLEFEWCVACTGCQCAKHKSVCCLHEECLHLHKVDFSQTTIMIICEKSLKDETIKVSGLDKWCQASKERETEKHSKVNPLPSTVKEGAPSEEELETLSQLIAEGWKPLGRRLGMNESKLTGFDKENQEYSEKPYKMLLRWKQRGGSAATYQVLHDALCHSLVNRRDLAEEICGYK